MNLDRARAVQRTAREVNDAAQRLQVAQGDDATVRAAEEYVASRAAHVSAVAESGLGLDHRAEGA